LQLLDLFWKMKKKDAAKVVSIYKLFVKETDALIGLYEIGKRFVRQLPEIKKAETTIIESMDKHVESLEDEESTEESGSDKSGGGKKKNKKKSKKKHSSDSSDGAQLKEEEDPEYEVSEEQNRKYEDDSDEQPGDSSSEEQEEPEDLLKDFFNTPAFPGVNVPFQPPQIVPPSFGPGAQIIQQQEPSRLDKINYIKGINETNAFASNPFNNPFTSGGAVANPGGNALTPYPGTLTGFNPLGNTANPFTAQPNNASVYGSSPGGFTGGAYTTAPTFGNPGFGSNPTNVYGSNQGFSTNSAPTGNFFGGGAAQAAPFGGAQVGVSFGAPNVGANPFANTQIQPSNPFLSM